MCIGVWQVLRPVISPRADAKALALDARVLPRTIVVPSGRGGSFFQPLLGLPPESKALLPAHGSHSRRHGLQSRALGERQYMLESSHVELHRFALAVRAETEKALVCVPLPIFLVLI